MNSPRATLRTVALHAAATAAVIFIVAAAASAGIARNSRTTVAQTAVGVSTAATATLLAHLAAADLTAPDPRQRLRVLADLEPYLRSGTLFRVKLWLIQGGVARIIVCDQAQLEGLSRPATGPLTPAAAGPGPLTMVVPGDAEHRLETGQAARLLEVFTSFRDSAGNLLSLETYVPANVGEATWQAVQTELPLLLLALLVISICAFPLTATAVRYRNRTAGHHTAVAAHTLSAVERLRYDMARRLHDGPIQNLAAANVALSVALSSAQPGTGASPSTSDTAAGIARRIVQASIAELRDLTSDTLAAPESSGASVRLEDLPSLLRAAIPAEVVLNTALQPQAVGLAGPAQRTLIVRAATELTRNAVRHGKPRRITVGLTAGDGTLVLSVRDDGEGFTPGQAPPHGHVGLALLTHAAALAGGLLEVESVPGKGCTAILRLPA